MLKKVEKIIHILLAVFLVIVIINIVEPLFCRQPDQGYAEELSHMEFESDTTGSERILCIDGNEEALFWRLRMIGCAESSIVLSTFDLRPDNSGTDMIAALYHAAEKGVKVRILIDGVYQLLYLRGSDFFQALTAHENVEVRIYNPVTVKNLLRLNYRMHDKYLIVDGRMYMLGGRNTNDIFLGDRKEGINVDRDILVYDVSGGNGESLCALQEYFQEIWEEGCTEEKKAEHSMAFYASEYTALESRYALLREQYETYRIENFQGWEEITHEANKITLLTNGTKAERKRPLVLQAIEYLAEQGNQVMIQTPYVICNQYMYDVLKNMDDNAEVKVILNAVEKGSNPWGCTDYLNQKEKVLETGVDVYELMNEHAVHTKTVLIDDNISIIGSYNFDIRSTYLDTELMLVIDCEELNAHIRGIESIYMEKSREVLADGSEKDGALYQNPGFDGKKKIFYGILRILIRPIRHLL